MHSLKFQEQSNRFQEREDQAMAAELKLQECTNSWEDQKKAQAAETKKLEARCADLVNQNSTLHSQLEKVSITIRVQRNQFCSLPFRQAVVRMY